MRAPGRSLLRCLLRTSCSCPRLCPARACFQTRAAPNVCASLRGYVIALAWLKGSKRPPTRGARGVSTSEAPYGTEGREFESVRSQQAATFVRARVAITGELRTSTVADRASQVQRGGLVLGR